MDDPNVLLRKPEDNYDNEDDIDISKKEGTKEWEEIIR